MNKIFQFNVLLYIGSVIVGVFMSVGLNFNPYQPTFRRKETNSEAQLKMADWDKIPGVDTVNDTITDFANEGKIKSKKALNIIMTVGLGVAAFFTGKRISKTVMDSLCHSTTYLNSLTDTTKSIFKLCIEPLHKLNPENSTGVLKLAKSVLSKIPKNLKNFARSGVHREIELEKFAKELQLKDVKALTPLDMDRFEAKFCNTIVKNGISKIIASTIGLITGAETFIEVGADKNKNGIPDLFEQKTYKQIVEISQPKIDEKVIEQIRKFNEEEKDD